MSVKDTYESEEVKWPFPAPYFPFQKPLHVIDARTHLTVKTDSARMKDVRHLELFLAV